MGSRDRMANSSFFLAFSLSLFYFKDVPQILQLATRLKEKYIALLKESHESEGSPNSSSLSLLSPVSSPGSSPPRVSSRIDVPGSVNKASSSGVKRVKSNSNEIKEKKSASASSLQQQQQPLLGLSKAPLAKQDTTEKPKSRPAATYAPHAPASGRAQAKTNTSFFDSLVAPAKPVPKRTAAASLDTSRTATIKSTSSPSASPTAATKPDPLESTGKRRASLDEEPQIKRKKPTRRVRFKPDHLLTNIRHYTPDPEEWKDHDTHESAREMDIREGQAMAQLLHHSNEQWVTPPRLQLPQECVLDRGRESNERHMQAQIQARTPATVYLSEAHIPPSPAEPLEQPDPNTSTPYIPLYDVEYWHQEQQQQQQQQQVYQPPQHQFQQQHQPYQPHQQQQQTYQPQQQYQHQSYQSYQQTYQPQQTQYAYR
ncbi:hypothetical protein BC940DRAFT_151319 [Gongronella butleri]|nr:hypothetical protein BC940DRAFT_151319 [Gongronella butleri]